jgi:hypothetical protein
VGPAGRAVTVRPYRLAATLDAIARPLPQVRDVQWRELRRRATVVFLWLQAGWSTLSAQEREEVRRLVGRSRGRPRNLSREEARRLGRLAAKAASGAASHRRK